MKKIEYLKKVINETNLYEDKKWYVSCFGILLPNDGNKEIKNLELIRTLDGLYTFIENENRNEKIDDYIEDKPLFNFNDKIEIDTSWNINTNKKLITTIGNLCINKLVLYSVIKNKVDFIEGKITSDTFENIILQRLKDDKDLTEKDISIKEMISIIDRLYFLTNLAELINITATEKNIVAPTDIQKRKKELLEKYQNSLTDPVKLVEFENELRKIDDDFLKDDPSYGIALSGKSKQARKKMFLVFGSDKDFDEKTKINPILESLEEGLNVSEDKFPEYMNSLRFGSFARGKLTAESGTQTKVLLRSLGTLIIENKDCGTKKGIARDINEINYKKLLNREVKIGNTWKLIDNLDEAKKLVGKNIEIRSALYCKSPKYTLCSHCTSKIFENSPNAIYHLSTEMSSIMMTMFLKLMHDSSMSNTKIDVKDLCT